MDDLASKPLPLKQRTSSIDQRRDYSQKTWLSLLQLIKPREYLITVDNFSIWRRHIAWAMNDGGDLRGYMTQRFASNMVFMSLLLGAELNVLFNSDWIATEMRKSMREERTDEISFWIGIIMIISVFLTILSLFATFSAWGMVSAVSDENAHCVLRSSMGQYVAELPGRFIVCSFYAFFIWSILYCFLLLPVGYISYFLVISVTIAFLHVVVVMSSFGRLIMHSGAMGSESIFEKSFEKSLNPHQLHASLLSKARAQLKTNTSIMRQYRQPPRPLHRMTSDRTITKEIILERNSYRSMESDLSDVPSDTLESPLPPPTSQPNMPKPTHKRGTSSVRFADDFLSSVNKHPHEHHETQHAGTDDNKEFKEKRRSTRSNKGSGSEKDKGNRQWDDKRGVIETTKPQLPKRSSKAPRYASDSSIEEWLQGASPAESPVVQNEQAEPLKFWSNQKLEHRRDRDFAAAHTPSSDGHESFVLRPADEEAPPPPPPPPGRSFRHPLSTPSPRDYPADVLALQANISMTSSLGEDDDIDHGDDDEDTFVREYGFNPDGKPVMPSPSPPAGIKYAQYFERQNPSISESQSLIEGDGLRGNNYTSNPPKKQHVRRSSLKKLRKWGPKRAKDGAGESET
mmetsp:Transcript_25981/g.36620  ORF Transcript_25981/g.36620 Transcript_25981/m.36620 type:complete len:627 (+) Transcript_25981:229-2109(+)